MPTCNRCKKPLSDPASVQAGMGPVCRGHANAERGGDEAVRSEFSDQFDDSIPFRQALVMKRLGTPDDADIEQSVITNIPHLVVHHSPTGFEFGYAGSGPADLALNVCQLYLNMVEYTGQKEKCYDGNCWGLAWVLHQEFKRTFIANVPRRGATIPFEKIEAWFDEQMTPELILRNQVSERTDEDE